MNDPEPASVKRPTQNVSLSSHLLHFAHQFQGERISVRELKNSLGRRSFGLMLFVLAIPNSLPILGIPGVSAVTGMPILLIALQMMWGSHQIWMPKWMANSSVSRQGFQSIIEKTVPWLARLEKLMKPRLDWLVKGRVEQLLGGVCAFMAFLLILPIPLGNLLPGVSILLISLGLIERDGVLVLLGLMMSIISLIYLQGLIWVSIQTVGALFNRWMT